MTISQQQFLELLRSGLWGTPADPALFTKETTDWKQIYRIAKEQTVQVIVADGMESLPKELWPAKEIMLKFMLAKVKASQMHSLLNSTICQVVKTLKSENIPSVLLKGQGLAKNYRIPESRMCGDIDLYVGLENFEKAYRLLTGEDSKEKYNTLDRTLHGELQIGNAMVELHKRADSFNSPKLDKSLQQWTIESLDRNFEKGITLPPHSFNAFFILHHAVRHMVAEGVGFRQICDWTMFLHRYHKEIDIIELEPRLNEFHMSDVWKEFGILAVRHLGMPPEELPLSPDSLDSSKTERLLQDIFRSGNFGHHSSYRRTGHNSSYIKRKWRSFKVQSSRLFIMFRLFPRFALSYNWHWFTDALQRFFKGLSSTIGQSAKQNSSKTNISR